MNKSLTAVLLFFLVVGGMGFLFSKWWRDRTVGLALPQVTASPAPRTSNLSSLLARMRPLADDERTFELSSKADWISGLVRYSEEGSQISFTVFLLPIRELDSDLFLWIKTGDKVISYGVFENGKGGLLVSGSIEKKALPVQFLVAPKVNNQMGEAILSGELVNVAL